MSLSGLDIFKYLPASKKEEHSNCKECGCSSCMAFAMKVLKDNKIVSNCPYAEKELGNLFKDNKNFEQKIVEIGLSCKKNIGGENSMFRHEKGFLSPTAFVISLNTDDVDFENKLKRVLKFKISKLSNKFKIDGVLLKGSSVDEPLREWIENQGVITLVEKDLEKFLEVNDDEKDFSKTLELLVNTRRKIVLEGDDNFSNPTYVYLRHQTDLLNLTARASFYTCKYANMLIFEDFDEAMFSTLIDLRQCVFSNPQKPLQVESKIYEFHEVDENSIIFLTTNFTLTYYSIANELESLDVPSYLIVVPTGGMSVLTAWASEKLTTKLISETIDKFNLREKVKTREIVIPGLLAQMKEDLQREIPDFKIVVGTKSAYLTKDFVKTYRVQNFVK